MRSAFKPCFSTLPGTLPVFPLEGVLLLPTGRLPLNIFEPRYLRMIDEALAGDRMIGMIQPREPQDHPVPPGTPVFETGCAGRITEFTETPDGRYLIVLTGICRFRIRTELQTDNPYRSVEAEWTPFAKDMDAANCLDLDREKLTRMLKAYFHAQDISCDWDMVEDASDNSLITCLSMICPFKAEEKQALLEAPCCHSRADLFMTMLEMALCEQRGCENRH